MISTPAKKPPSASTTSPNLKVSDYYKDANEFIDTLPRFYSVVAFEEKGVPPPPASGRGGNGDPFWRMRPQDFLAHVEAERTKQHLANENHYQKWITLLGVPT